MQVQKNLLSTSLASQWPFLPSALQLCSMQARFPLGSALQSPSGRKPAACSTHGSPSSFSQAPLYSPTVRTTKAAPLETPRNSAPNRQDKTTAFRVLITKLLMNSLNIRSVSYTHLRAHETRHDLVCRLLLEKKKK